MAAAFDESRNPELTILLACEANLYARLNASPFQLHGVPMGINHFGPCPMMEKRTQKRRRKNVCMQKSILDSWDWLAVCKEYILNVSIAILAQVGCQQVPC